MLNVTYQIQSNVLNLQRIKCKNLPQRQPNEWKSNHQRSAWINVDCWSHFDSSVKFQVSEFRASRFKFQASCKFEDAGAPSILFGKWIFLLNMLHVTLFWQSFFLHCCIVNEQQSKMLLNLLTAGAWCFVVESFYQNCIQCPQILKTKLY